MSNGDHAVQIPKIQSHYELTARLSGRAWRRGGVVRLELKSVWERQPVISRLVLMDAELDLERQADTPKRLFPNQAFNGERLKALDAHVILDARKLYAAELPVLESLRVTADLDDGVLLLKPIDIGMAGGHVAGLFTLDGKNKPPSAHARMELKEVRLEELLDRPAKGAKSAGPLTGHIDLKGRGDSVATILASASGSVEVAMKRGGISNLLDAKLGLNGGKILRLLITGDRAIGINNAIVAFDFETGRGKSKAILLDTDQTHTEGTGTLDLHDETVDVLLTPHPKKPGLFSLNSTIRVHGPFRQPEFSIVGKDKRKEERRD